MQPPKFPPSPQKTRLWTRTPPALFTPVFGLFGLAVAWRRAGDAFAVGDGVSDLLFGAVTLLYLFLLVAYFAKVVRRPATYVEDAKILPGRGGLAAMSLSGMLMALGLIHWSQALAATVLAIAVIMHAVLFVTVVYLIATGPKEAKSVTPIWHLTFVGFIISPIAGMPLGWTTWSLVVFWASLAIAAFVWGASAAQYARQRVPAPLRPLLAIHLAPAAVLGTVALLLGYQTLALVLGLVSILIFAALILRPFWMAESGFSPLWGAFTFPLAAFASLMMLLGSAGYSEVFRYVGGVALVAATLAIPVIMWKVNQLWAKGMLAVKTNASEV